MVQPPGPPRESNASGGFTAEDVNALHDFDDVDVSPMSHHHTLGPGENQAAPGVEIGKLKTTIETLAPLASPALTGNPTAPTPATADNDTSIATTAFVQTELAAIAVPAGNVEMTARSSAPTGWLLCDGAAVSRTTYAALFSAIGTAYGAGDGSTTFNVPNLKGRVPVGRDSGQTEFDVLGETGGAKTHTLALSETPAHWHRVGISAALDGTVDVHMVQETSASTYPGWSHTVSGTGGGLRAVITDTQGGGAAHNNLPPYIVLNFIIKV